MTAVLVKQTESAKMPFDTDAMTPEELRAWYVRERRYWNEGGPRMKRIKNDMIPGPNGMIPTRYYYPKTDSVEPLPGLIYLHGGGFVVGDLDTHDRVMRLLADRSGFVVIGVDYHPAPDVKFPVQVKETVSVLRHIETHGRVMGIDPDRLAAGGDSAGANLGMAAAVSLKPDHPDLINSLLLYYGTYGLRDSRTMRIYGNSEDGLTERDMLFYRDSYLRNPTDQDDPLYNILSADLSGLPPAHIIAAEFDPLLDDSLALGALLDRAGVPNRVRVYDGVLHGFIQYSRMLEKADQALADGARALVMNVNT